MQIPLAAGINNVRLQKNTLFSELDYVTVTLGSSSPAAAVDAAQTAHPAGNASPPK